MKRRIAVEIENSKRAVFLTSDISQEAYAALVPHITRLRLASADPICLFIHSFGGDPFVAEQILRLLRAPRQDGDRCMVTTVCLGIAASAAADMLSAGDYAIAYSDSVILVHGTRSEHNEITIETLREAEEDLREDNEYFAMKLASKMFRRFATQALLLEVFKTDPPAANVIGVGADPNQILAQIKLHVQEEHRALVDCAIDRMARVKTLFEYVESKKSGAPTGDSIVSDADLLKTVVEFESGALRDRKAAGELIAGFTPESVSLIGDDFVRLKNFLDGAYWQQALQFCHQKGHYFLTKEEMEAFRAIPEIENQKREEYLESKSAPKVFPLWYLVVSLCRLLQEGENMFTASDAWWFGLIDEVPGTALPSIRRWRDCRRKTIDKKEPLLSH